MMSVIDSTVFDAQDVNTASNFVLSSNGDGFSSLDQNGEILDSQSVVVPFSWNDSKGRESDADNADSARQVVLKELSLDNPTGILSCLIKDIRQVFRRSFGMTAEELLDLEKALKRFDDEYYRDFYRICTDEVDFDFNRDVIDVCKVIGQNTFIVRYDGSEPELRVSESKVIEALCDAADLYVQNL